jgi:aminoglycoside phosphotransferase (APT) family kinase protein
MQPKIDVALVQNLIASQIPQWKNLPISPVENGGWDNRTFYLGDSMLIRMPSAEIYASKIEKKFRWLPILAPLLPNQIPVSLVMGKPNEEYPWQWGVYKWLEGETVSGIATIDLNELAHDLASFLNALHLIDTSGGPLPGAHNFYRGGSLEVYDAEVQQAITILKDKIDAVVVRKIWESALATSWQKQPVWVHGDIASGNLLVKDGKLSAVIDLGGLAIGDPACDLAIAWTLFNNESRKIFKDTLSLDAATWNRGKAWALWKALIIAAEIINGPAIEKKQCWRIITALSTL